MLSVGFNKFNTVNFQGDSFKSREKRNLNLQTQPDTVSFKQNSKEMLSTLNHIVDMNSLRTRFDEAHSKMPSAVRTYLEGLVNNELTKCGDNPVDWTKLTESVKKTVKKDQTEGKTFTYYYKDPVHTFSDTVNFKNALECVEMVIAESRIGKLTEELEKTAKEYNQRVIQYYFPR